MSNEAGFVNPLYLDLTYGDSITLYNIMVRNVAMAHYVIVFLSDCIISATISSVRMPN